MRIAAAVCSYPPYRGGIGNAAARQAAALVEAGHQVRVLCPAHDGARRDEVVDGIEVRRLPALVRHGVSAFVPTLARHLGDVDALYLHYPFYGGAEVAALAARARRIPYIAFFHMDVRAGGLRGGAIRAYDRTVAPAILRGARRVMVSSFDYAKDATLGRLRLRNLRELPYGVDTSRFSPGAPDPGAMHRLGLDGSVPIILFVGGMDAGHAFKGVPVLIEAMAGLPRGAARLVAVGDGELRPGFEALASARLGEDVRFVGSAPDDLLRDLYRAAAVTVLPSVTREEAFGIVLIESMACGTPVIASDLPGVRTVLDEETGLLATPGDAARLREALRALIGDTARRERMGARARLRAQERYSRERERDQLAAEFSALQDRA